MPGAWCLMPFPCLLIETEVEDVGPGVVAGYVECHDFAVDGGEIKFGGEDCFFVEDGPGEDVAVWGIDCAAAIENELVGVVFE